MSSKQRDADDGSTRDEEGEALGRFERTLRRLLATPPRTHKKERKEKQDEK